MPLMETVTIINKSGKVVSTGKHLANIFKDARDAYKEKKEALHAEHQARIREKSDKRLAQAREETRSIASSRHSRSSHRSRRHDEYGPRDAVSRPPLTMRNLSMVSEGSVVSARSGKSRHSKRSSSHHGGEHRSHRSPKSYHSPYIENAEPSTPYLVRRHTDLPSPRSPNDFNASQLSRVETLPPPYTSQVTRRVNSVPDLHAQDDEGIDMNLAYGPLPPELRANSAVANKDQQELATTMSKLDALLLEAQCLHHSATAIITNLQANPEAMAAVALTLAELSNILSKMGPGILAALKTSSPAAFALLASPQFLIAGGLAVGVTVVMFGGFKIIKKLQNDAAVKKEAHQMQEALVYDERELSTIDTWRRGIAEVEARSVATSVDGEFITPEAMRQKKERIRDRAREERLVEVESVVSGQSGASGRSGRTLRRADSESTIRPRKPMKATSETVVSSRIAPSEGGKSRRSKTVHEGSVRGKGKKKEPLMIEERKDKKSNALSIFLKRNKADKAMKRESELSHRPKLIDI